MDFKEEINDFEIFINKCKHDMIKEYEEDFLKYFTQFGSQILKTPELI